MSMFVPENLWSFGGIPPEDFFDRMYKRVSIFLDGCKKAKGSSAGFDFQRRKSAPLLSIVQAEAKKR